MGGNKSDKSSAEEGLRQTGDKVAQAAAQTPQEASQYSNSFDIGKLLQQIYQGQMGMGPMPQGMNQTQNYLQQGGDLAQGIYNQVSPYAQNPDYGYESTFMPQLKQLQDYTDTTYQRRGLLNSGLNIEQMGRAGIDLAVRSAQERMAYRQQGLQNMMGLEGDMYNRGQSNVANLANLYGNQQQLGQASMGRQAQGMQAAAPYYSYGPQAQLGQYYAQKNLPYQLGGQIIGAAGQMGSAALMGGV